EAELCKSLADQIAVSIDHAKEYMSVSSKSQQLAWTLRNQELESGKRRAAMETELKKSREEVALFAQRLHQYETSAESDQQRLQGAQAEIVKLEKTIERAKIEVEKSRQKDKQLASLQSETESAQQTLETLKSELQALKAQNERLTQDASEVERLTEALQVSNRRSRKLHKALKRARALNQQATPVPAALSSAEASRELEDLSCGVIIGDTNDRINRINASATAILSPNKADLMGEALETIFADENWRNALQHLKNNPDSMITTTLRANKTILRATISSIASSEDEGRSGTVTILYDITAEAESQQARDEFVASLSQELRTPMTSITGYTDLLLGESVGIIGDMQRKFLQRIKANIERMGSMLSDLIGVTAIDAGQLEVRTSVIDMTEVIEDTIINARAQLEENAIPLTMNLLEDMPPVEADPDSVRQIMSNLLNNAIKCTPANGSITISASIHEEKNEDSPDDPPTQFLDIAIRDSGGGVAEKELSRVFERFYQAERPLIEGLGETGVGLAIVKSLVEAHGGTVWAESEIGDGTTIHFLLPISDQYDDPWLEIDIPPLDLNSDQLDL
ncbi:MAG: ATP-binding protein, partial [Chloroflexota bacterium]